MKNHSIVPSDLKQAVTVSGKSRINKGFSFQDFKNASAAAHRAGAGVKAYLLLQTAVSDRGRGRFRYEKIHQGYHSVCRYDLHEPLYRPAQYRDWSITGNGVHTAHPISGVFFLSFPMPRSISPVIRLAEGRSGDRITAEPAIMRLSKVSGIIH